MATQLNENSKSLDASLEIQSQVAGRRLLRQAKSPKLTIRDSIAGISIVLTAAIGFFDITRPALWSMLFAAQLAIWLNVRSARQLAALCDLLKRIESPSALSTLTNAPERDLDAKLRID